MIAIVVVALAALVSHADPLTGKVVGISDGDTITLLDSTKVQHKIRLAHIDCPETSQAFGTKAKQVLSDKIFGRVVNVTVTETDRYKRKIGEVRLGDRFINLEMVTEGYAWHYKQFSKDPKFADAEITARAGNLGLWVDKSPAPPWEFRKAPPGAASSATDQIANKAPAAVAVAPAVASGTASAPAAAYWINDASNTRHNSRCKYFNNTKLGHFSDTPVGKACGICGG